MEKFELLSQYGVAGVTLSLVLGFLFYMVRWFLNQWEKLNKEVNQERAKWFDIIQGLSDRINNHATGATGFHEKVDEAHKYQREEHQRMCDCLQEIAVELKNRPCLIEKR